MVQEVMLSTEHAGTSNIMLVTSLLYILNELHFYFMIDFFFFFFFEIFMIDCLTRSLRSSAGLEACIFIICSWCYIQWPCTIVQPILLLMCLSGVTLSILSYVDIFRWGQLLQEHVTIRRKREVDSQESDKNLNK